MFYLYRLRHRPGPMAISIVVFVVGLFFVLWGGFKFILHKQSADRCSSVTYGLVVDVEKDVSYDEYNKRTTYVATVKPNDSTIFGTSTLSTGKTDYAYTEGLYVEINYDPSDPSNYYIQFSEPSSGDLKMVIIGGVMSVIALFVFFGIKKYKELAS